MITAKFLEEAGAQRRRAGGGEKGKEVGDGCESVLGMAEPDSIYWAVGIMKVEVQ